MWRGTCTSKTTFPDASYRRPLTRFQNEKEDMNRTGTQNHYVILPSVAEERSASMTPIANEDKVDDGPWLHLRICNTMGSSRHDIRGPKISGLIWFKRNALYGSPCACATASAFEMCLRRNVSRLVSVEKEQQSPVPERPQYHKSDNCHCKTRLVNEWELYDRGIDSSA
jgi:hypothetical protein